MVRKTISFDPLNAQEEISTFRIRHLTCFQRTRRNRRKDLCEENLVSSVHNHHRIQVAVLHILGARREYRSRAFNLLKIAASSKYVHEVFGIHPEIQVQPFSDMGFP